MTPLRIWFAFTIIRAGREINKNKCDIHHMTLWKGSRDGHAVFGTVQIEIRATRPVVGPFEEHGCLVIDLLLHVGLVLPEEKLSAYSMEL